MSKLPVGYSFRFSVATPPASKKNGRQWKKYGRRKFLMPSDKAMASEVDVAAAARIACGGVMPFDRDDAVRIDYEHDIVTDAVMIRVWKCGTIPQRNRGTKRDVHGMSETIADALQGVLYPNDNQVDEWRIERVRPLLSPSPAGCGAPSTLVESGSKHVDGALQNEAADPVQGGAHGALPDSLPEAADGASVDASKSRGLDPGHAGCEPVEQLVHRFAAGGGRGRGGALRHAGRTLPKMSGKKKRGPLPGTDN